MTAEDMATEQFVDREIARLRDELRHLKELWLQQTDSNAVALVLQTAQVAEHMEALNHAKKMAADVAATTVDSKRYEEQMTSLREQLQAIKDSASGALVGAVADIARQLAAAHVQIAANKEEALGELTRLDRRVSDDISTRAGRAEGVGEEAKKASRRALAFAILGAIVGALGLLLGVARFLTGGAP
jgi:uncharacterized phage infection (PIP) family protein YhgE